MTELHDVKVVFWKACDLTAADPTVSHPYLKARISNTTLATRTRPTFDIVDPVWDEEWYLCNIPLGCRLMIEIWDYDGDNKDDFLGLCTYPFDGKSGEIKLNVILDQKKHGELALKVDYHPKSTENSGVKSNEIRSLGPIYYEHHVISLIQSKIDADISVYSTYKVRFPNIAEIFEGVKLNWNVSYWSAQKIFGATPASASVRQSIHSLHSSLYRHSKSSRYGTLKSGLQFLNLFNFARRKEAPRFYTYTILEDSMRFSETGKKLDSESKHATQADCSEQVYCAGEFCVQHTEEDKWVFMIDNNSGTYAPSKTILPKLALLFSSNFPDLLVEALDHKDPKLVAIRRVCI